MIDINRVGAQLYSTLHEETGIPTGFRATGSLTVTTTNDRMDELKRILSLGRCYGIEIHEISAEDAGTMWPLMRTDDLQGRNIHPEGRPRDPGQRGVVGRAGGGDRWRTHRRKRASYRREPQGRHGNGGLDGPRGHRVRGRRVRGGDVVEAAWTERGRSIYPCTRLSTCGW